MTRTHRDHSPPTWWYIPLSLPWHPTLIGVATSHPLGNWPWAALLEFPRFWESDLDFWRHCLELSSVSRWLPLKLGVTFNILVDNNHFKVFCGDHFSAPVLPFLSVHVFLGFWSRCLWVSVLSWIGVVRWGSCLISRTSFQSALISSLKCLIKSVVENQVVLELSCQASVWSVTQHFPEKSSLQSQISCWKKENLISPWHHSLFGSNDVMSLIKFC